MGDPGVHLDSKSKECVTHHGCRKIAAVMPTALLASTVIVVGWMTLERVDLELRRIMLRTLAIGLAVIGPFHRTLTEVRVTENPKRP